ncbi:MAG TPA: glycoside hydrolase family 97 N-terminal domain-containing protein, partial [Terriglobales bacterium]|nr:glycoside hydrolase family 97 N-terminal domain-containing protein [Terriglobales bacterium]
MSSFLGKVLFVIVVSMLCIENSVAQSSYDLRSPDGQVELRIRTSDRLRYDVLLNGNALLENCTLSLDIEHKKLGIQPKVLDAKERSNNEVIKPVIRQKFAQLHDNYNEIRLTIDGGYAVVFRVYNEGVAYR